MTFKPSDFNHWDLGESFMPVEIDRALKRAAVIVADRIAEEMKMPMIAWDKPALTLSVLVDDYRDIQFSIKGALDELARPGEHGNATLKLWRKALSAAVAKIDKELDRRKSLVSELV